jgi:hypothetical protein
MSSPALPPTTFLGNSENKDATVISTALPITDPPTPPFDVDLETGRSKSVTDPQELSIVEKRK